MAPSSARLLLLGGMLPGEMPPTSAWWPREATKKTMRPASHTGVMTVMSGKWEPPAATGWLVTSVSPSLSPSSLPGPSVCGNSDCDGHRGAQQLRRCCPKVKHDRRVPGKAVYA